jgi:hypothetical protein
VAEATVRVCARSGCNATATARVWCESDYRRQIRMGRVGYRDAGPARAHVRQLRRLGWPYEPLAKTAGVSAWVVHKLDTGITRRLLSESEAAVLSVPLVPYRSRRGVDGTGTYRRLEALQWQGWPPAVVAARLGLSPYTLRSMAGRGQRVSYRVALGMARVFREMSTAALFAAVFATLYAGHMLADHVLGQTDRQALGKSAPGWRGWGWCLAHVAQYHLVLAAMLAVAGWVSYDLGNTVFFEKAETLVGDVRSRCVNHHRPETSLHRELGEGRRRLQGARRGAQPPTKPPPVRGGALARSPRSPRPRPLPTRRCSPTCARSSPST